MATPRRGLRLPLGIRDPGHAALRRAGRAAIVIPLAFAFVEFVLKEPNALIFVVFGCFALLVISDFGGLRRARATAYLATTAIGALLIVLGTLASSNAFSAGAAMFVLALMMTFARVFGGYIAAAQTGLLLLFVVSLTIPAPASAIASRLTGWAIAGAVSTLAATMVWPRFERVKLHKFAARACLAVADAMEALGSASPATKLTDKIEAARQAEQEASQQFKATAKRPAGPARRDRAFVELLSELERMTDILEHPFEQAGSLQRPRLLESEQLTRAAVAAMRSSASLLTGGRQPPDLRAVEEARVQHRAALDRWAEQRLHEGRPVGDVLDGIDADHTLRVLAYLVIALASNAIITAGEDPPATSLPSSTPAGGKSGTLLRVIRTVRSHLDPNSTVLQGSLRVAIGLTAAVSLARVLALSHAFWVVLGALQVLRSNALGTGRTTIQALVGNAIGVIAGGLFAVLAGNHPVAMWVALPVAIFVAAYAAGAIGFMASQAAFTINLIVIFNLIAPTGWKIGIARLEDLGVGVGISVLVGILLWPYGARREFARNMAGYYRALASYVRQTFARVLGLQPPGSARADLRPTLAARDRAGEAFDTLLNEHSASSLDPRTAGMLLSAGNHILLAADILDFVSAQMGYRGEGCPDGAANLQPQVEAMVGGFLRLSSVLDLSAKTTVEPPSVEKIRAAELDCLRRWRSDPAAGRGAMAVVIAGEWVVNLSRLEDALQRPVAVAAEAAARPWWR
jgi:uncharacterized membrane protein YccC